MDSRLDWHSFAVDLYSGGKYSSPGSETVLEDLAPVNKKFGHSPDHLVRVAIGNGHFRPDLKGNSAVG